MCRNTERLLLVPKRNPINGKEKKDKGMKGDNGKPGKVQKNREEALGKMTRIDERRETWRRFRSYRDPSDSFAHAKLVLTTPSPQLNPR